MLPPNHPAAPNLEPKGHELMQIIPSGIAHTIYESARMVLMDAVISVTQ